ncbi:unnamed protein product [Owenia fusiformis]|uniref:Fibrinogen C-terminal domain-containing protein n=1 Tax=Owenia fusiformis TaxID=6347 RepID=A0A8S4PYR7_OWEFU|nr:unnamed protein product [Owenia fusiformis]
MRMNNSIGKLFLTVSLMFYIIQDNNAEGGTIGKKNCKKQDLWEMRDTITGDVTTLKEEVSNLREEVSKLKKEVSTCANKPDTKCDSAELREDIQKILATVMVPDCKNQQDGRVNIRTTDRIFQTQCINGWLVFAQRFDGSVDFYRNWADYKNGFGQINGEYFLGFNNILSILKQGSYKLRIEITTWPDQGNVTKYAEYSTFDLAGESEQYRITVSGYSGTAGDGMAYSNNAKFTTRDQDRDTWSSGNCATREFGAWWYKFCTYANLYGPYMSSSQCDVRARCMYWYKWPQSIGHPDNFGYSFREIRMMIRRV